MEKISKQDLPEFDLPSEFRPRISTVLDLAVNFASERGLLGIALHPDFPANPGVYLYWTCRTMVPPGDPFVPDEQACPEFPTLGADTGEVLEVPLLGNRVDRFTWDGSSLTFDSNLIMLRAFQNDGAPFPPGQGDGEQSPAGNHDGGVIRFGPDGKLYIIIGDVGRRGLLQNLPFGPTAPGVADDQFGGPEPDSAHLTGVILRLNDDGTIPDDNPFFNFGTLMIEQGQTQVGENIQKIFAFGIRNSFGMAFDPKSGHLWTQENGDDTFDEINRIPSGFNSGWVQIMGPVGRIDEFKAIEVNQFGQTLQQLRWPPMNIADTPTDALSRLSVLPESVFSEPEFSWKFAVAPGGIGFLNSRALGAKFEGDLFVGAARPFLEGGYLLRLKLTENREMIDVDDPRLEDRVADNQVAPPPAKGDLTESESLLFGRNFGIGTDIQTGPRGSLFVVSLSDGAIYEIFRRPLFLH